MRVLDLLMTMLFVLGGPHAYAEASKHSAVAQQAPAVTKQDKPKLTLKGKETEVGANALDLVFPGAAGETLSLKDLLVTIYMPAMGSMPRMEAQPTIKSDGKGKFRVEFELSMAGTWEIEIRTSKDPAGNAYFYSLTTGIPGVNDKNNPQATATTPPSHGAPTLDIGPARLQKVGVTFASAKIQTLTKTVRAVGLVESDNTKKSEVTLRFSGYVEKQYKGQIGDFVEAGTPLFTVYSPEIVAAQGEFLLHHGDAGSANLNLATRERLRNLGLSERDLTRIQKSGKTQRTVTITAPQAGTLLEVNVREGSSFAQGQLLYTIGDLSKTYIVARVFQRDLGDLKIGQGVEIETPEREDSSGSGSIDLIYPNITEGEGTANVRVRVPEKSATLKPGTYAVLYFPVDYGQKLTIPSEAVLYSGKHQYVFVDLGSGRLEPREIKIGRSSDTLVEVKSGLTEGERVLASGAFLISSEAQLRSALPKWKSNSPEGAYRPVGRESQ